MQTGQRVWHLSGASPRVPLPALPWEPLGWVPRRRGLGLDNRAGRWDQEGELASLTAKGPSQGLVDRVHLLHSLQRWSPGSCSGFQSFL